MAHKPVFMLSSLTMPVDFEPLYSASPPLFKHFGHAIAEYRMATTFTAHHNHQNGTLGCGQSARLAAKVALRPCLIIRAEDCTDADKEGAGDTPLSPTSPTKSKKRVVFADDRGFALEQVKVMTEPSDCPPRWRDEFFEHVTRGETVKADLDRWEPMFPQPASDYLEFRRKLERSCVSLENVIAKETDQTVTGTVKVKNIAFDKEVSVRVTTDSWVTTTNYPCCYVPSGSEGTSVYDLYDTFSFTFEIPPEAASKGSTIVFCILYSCEGLEYWDNNGGSNYKLIPVPSSTAKAGKIGEPTVVVPKFADAFTARIDTWTEFASWNHLVNDAPYW